MVKTDSFDIAASTYAEKASKGLWGWLKSKEKIALLRQLDRFISSSNELRVLDLGCGVGVYADLISQHLPNSSITGIDRSSKMMNIFKAKGYLGFNLDLETQYFNEGTFDFIVVLGLLEFVKKPQSILDTLMSSSNPDTKIFVLVPRFTPLNIFYVLYHRAHHTRVFLRSRADYVKLFSKSRFKLLSEDRATPVSRIFVFQKTSERNLP